MNLQLILSSVLALVSGAALLLFLDASTLFLAALLLAILTTKLTKNEDVVQQISGLWFALSVAPASKISLEKVTEFSNGFAVMCVLSFVLFLYFYTKKPSVIARLYNNQTSKFSKVLSAIVAGFAAGIMSAILWQAYLKLAAL